MRKMRKIQIQAIIAIALTLALLGAALLAGCGQLEPNPIEPKPSVSLGTWIDSHKVSERDNKPYPVKYQIQSITRNQEKVKAAIDSYNLSGAGNLIGELDNDNLEFCIARYSVKFPKNFPQSEFGITDVTIPFDIVSSTGGVIKVGDTLYQGLATTWEIGKVPQGYDFHAGDTYHGKIVFIMVKGYSDYLIHEIKETREDTEEVYIKGE